jgi:hypothetical protein
MFSALSFLPQTGSSSDEPSESNNVEMTNQQKLALSDAIVNEEDSKI